MANDVPFRQATKADAPDLAYLHALAGGGIVEFIFRDVLPGVGPIDLFAETFAGDAEPYTWRNCVVADDGGQVVGIEADYTVAECEQDSAPDRTPPLPVN